MFESSWLAGYVIVYALFLDVSNQVKLCVSECLVIVCFIIMLQLCVLWKVDLELRVIICYEDEREMILTSVRNAVCKGNQI